MCLYPKLIQNPKYKKTKKNKGVIPKMDDPRVGLVPIGCGNCMECCKKRSNGWKVRLMEEMRCIHNAKFVTFTFSDESLIDLEDDLKEDGCWLEGYDLENQIAKLAMRRFRERWRRKFKKSVKRWFVTELGGNFSERIHFHGLLWTDEPDEVIQERWAYGHVHVHEYVNESTITYLTKYMTKKDFKHKFYKPLVLCSPGIGSQYMGRYDVNNNKYKGPDTNEKYRFRSGFKVALPIYYRNYVYSEEEREKLWLHKLDEEIRWVDGYKIDVSENDDSYYHLLNLARLKNERLGYGDSEDDWERKRYERSRRLIQSYRRRKKVERTRAYA